MTYTIKTKINIKSLLSKCRDNFIPIIMFTIIIVFLSFILSFAIHSESEITNTEYEEVKQIFKEHPRIKEYFLCYTYDGYITKGEYRNIKNYKKVVDKLDLK